MTSSTTSDKSPRDLAPVQSRLRLASSLIGISADSATLVRGVAELAVSEGETTGALVVELRDSHLRQLSSAGELQLPQGDGLATLQALVAQTIASSHTHRRGVAPEEKQPFGSRDFLIAPLQLSEDVHGAVIAVCDSCAGFSEGDAADLGAFAQLSSLALVNAAKLERERLTSREARAIAEIVHELNQSLEVERVVSLVTERAQELLGGNGAVLGLLDGDVLKAVAATGTSRRFLGSAQPVSDTVTGGAIMARRTMRVTSRETDRLFTPATVRDGFKFSAITVPLLVADRPIGGIIVSDAEEREFSDRDEDLLRALASHSAIAIENSRLYRAAAHTARHAETLSMAARSLSESVLPGGFFDELFRVARELLGVDGLSVYSVNPERGHASIVYTAGAGSSVIGTLRSRIRDDELTALLLAGDAAFYSNIRQGDTEALLQRNFLVRPEEVVALARLPLTVEGRLQGALTLRWRAEKPFDEEERALLHDFALQAAMALRNADLIADLDRRAQRFSAVARMQQVISRTELREVYGEVTRSARTAVPQAQAVALLTISSDRTTLVPEVIVANDLSTWREALLEVPLGDCAASRVARTGERVTSNAPERSWPELVPGIALGTMRSEAAVPLMHDNEPSGVLIVQSEETGAFTAEDGDVLALLARQAGIAIENARLFEAERGARELAEAAAEISRIALASSGTDQTSQQVIETMDRVAPSPGKALGLVDVSGKLLRYLAASGTLRRLQHVVVPVEQSATTLVPPSESAPIAVGPEALAPLSERQVVSEGAILVPLVAKNRVLGVLWSDPSPSHENSATLHSLASTLALAADVLLLGEEERQRREREQMLATAVATMEQPVLIVGLDRRVLYANAAAGQEYGFAAEEFSGLSLDRLIDSWVPARRVEAESPSSTTGTWAAEHIHKRKDGSKFPASVLLSAIRDPAGVPVGQVVAVRNLTEEQRLQEQLRQTEKLAALGELVAGVAHELNNPLAGISAFAQLMMEDELTDEQHESVRLIKREADRAVGVIRDLLFFSRKSGPSKSMLDVNELVELTLRLRGYSLRSAGIEVAVELAPDIAPLFGDDQKLQQVLLNLIVNAEYALQRSEEKRVAIRTEQTTEGVALFVTDTGSGMTEEVRQRIFEPFFTTKSAGEGTGLGLSVSYGIVRAHGGTISVESHLGQGTTFRIDLPVARVVEAEPTVAESAAVAGTPLRL